MRAPARQQRPPGRRSPLLSRPDIAAMSNEAIVWLAFLGTAYTLIAVAVYIWLW